MFFRPRLPKFTYVADPVGAGVIAPSKQRCICCGKARGHIYTGPVYHEEEFDECFCPWCIADGAAHRKFGVEFFDGEQIGDGGAWPRVAAPVVEELVTRTPGFSGWQQERWFTCCGDAGVFLRAAGRTELTGELAAAVPDLFRGSGLTQEQVRDLVASMDAHGSPRAYLFRCRACGRYGGYWDCD